MIKQLFATVVVATMTVTGFAEADHIPITIPGNHGNNPGDGPHAPIQFFAQGYYDLGTDVLSLSFLQSVGPCTVIVTNTANECFVQPFDSDWGICVIYMSGTPGLYTIIIEAAGNQYYGSFMLL